MLHKFVPEISKRISKRVNKALASWSQEHWHHTVVVNILARLSTHWGKAANKASPSIRQRNSSYFKACNHDNPASQKLNGYHHCIQVHAVERNGKATFVCPPGTGLAKDMWTLGPNSAPGLKNRMTSMGCESSMLLESGYNLTSIQIKGYLCCLGLIMK